MSYFGVFHIHSYHSVQNQIGTQYALHKHIYAVSKRYESIENGKVAPHPHAFTSTSAHC